MEGWFGDARFGWVANLEREAAGVASGEGVDVTDVDTLGCH